MNIELKDSFNYKKTIFFLSAVTLLSGFVTAFLSQLGLFFIATTAPFLAGVFLFEKKGKRRFSYIIPVLLIILDIVFNQVYSFNCLASVIIALIMFFGFSRKWRKSECVVYNTVIITVFIGLGFLFAAFLNKIVYLLA